MDRGAWWATVQRVTKSRTRLSTEHAGIYLSHFVYLVILDGHLCHFHLLVFVNNAAVNGGCADIF